MLKKEQMSKMKFYKVHTVVWKNHPASDESHKLGGSGPGKFFDKRENNTVNRNKKSLLGFGW